MKTKTIYGLIALTAIAIVIAIAVKTSISPADIAMVTAATVFGGAFILWMEEL
jgi:hypothetical protein